MWRWPFPFQGVDMTTRMTAAEYLAAQKGQKRAAGRNAKRQTTPDGITHDSKAEARRWVYLLALQASGEISNLRRQVNIPLLGRDGPILTPTGRQMHYRADFVYTRAGVEVVEDVKGWENDVFPIKKAILAAQGIEITIVKG